MRRIRETGFCWQFFLALLLFGSLEIRSQEITVKGDVLVNYTYTLFYDGNQSKRTEVYRIIDEAGLDFLLNELSQAEVGNDVVAVNNFTSSVLSACSSTVAAAPENIGMCVETLGQVSLTLDAEIRYDLIERLSVNKVQLFIDEFNAANEGLIRIGYTSPILLKFTLVLEMTGVQTELTTDDALRLQAQLLNVLRAELAEGDPPFDLRDVRVVAQQLDVVGSQRQRRTVAAASTTRLLVVNSGDTFPVSATSYDDENNKNNHKQENHRRDQKLNPINHVEFVLVGNCAIVDGKESCIPSTVQEQAKTVTSEQATSMLQTLQQETTSSDYFDRVESIQVNTLDSILVINSTEILETGSDIPRLEETSEDDFTTNEDSPWWIWILIGSSVGILLLGSVFAYFAVQERNREALLRQAFEDNHRQSTRKHDMHSSASQSLATQGNVQHVESSTRGVSEKPQSSIVAEPFDALAGFNTLQGEHDDDREFSSDPMHANGDVEPTNPDVSATPIVQIDTQQESRSRPLSYAAYRGIPGEVAPDEGVVEVVSSLSEETSGNAQVSDRNSIHSSIPE